MANFSSTLDCIFGVSQTVVSLLGCVLNSLSFIYFTSLKSRNNNSKFFKHLYLIITFNDFCICAATIPVIEAAFSPNRAGVLFLNPAFCSSWTLLYFLLPQMSIFLVGILSISRLSVLKNPNICLNPTLPFILSGVASFTILAVSIGLLSADLLFADYVPEWLYCYPLGYSTSNASRVLSQAELDNAANMSKTANIIPILAILPITVSFVYTLVLLRRSSQLAASLNSSTCPQREASVTVAVVTLAYILFNIPYTAFILYYVLYLRYSLQDANVTVEDISSNYGQYSDAIVCVLLVSTNSMINPLLYYWRMSPFRAHWKRMWSRGNRQVGQPQSSERQA